MKTSLILILTAVLLGACSHQELKAPCGPTAALAAAGEHPCDIKPINMAELTDDKELL